MVESAEGIGGRKWSLGKHVSDDAQMHCETIEILQGKDLLAQLSKKGEDVKALIVTAPQLWDAANELLKTVRELATREAADGAGPPIYTIGDLNNSGVVKTLQNMVAKSVGKTDWTTVLQA